MVKFPEAEARLFRDHFVCRKCKSVIKTSNMMVLQRRARCRKCGSKDLRPVRKK